MFFNTVISKNIPKLCTNTLWRQYPIITRSATTTSKTETVDLAYSSYEFTDDTSSLPPLVILHGLLGSKNNWNSMSKAIHKTTGRKVISIDARNHGDSKHSPQHTYLHMAHDVIKLLKKLEISKVSVLGHSMGGRTAMVLSLLCVSYHNLILKTSQVHFFYTVQVTKRTVHLTSLWNPNPPWEHWLPYSPKEHNST